MAVQGVYRELVSEISLLTAKNTGKFREFGIASRLRWSVLICTISLLRLSGCVRGDRVTGKNREETGTASEPWGRDLASGVTMAFNITVPGRRRNSDHDLECPQEPRLARITNLFSH